MQKSFRSMSLIILTVFLISYFLSILAVSLGGSLSTKTALYLLFANLISIAAVITILGEAFTSLIGHFMHLRRLLKLNNLTNPLLLRLSKEAPGTYHHSILVADLASKAASDLRLDTLLCRIGGYFHDVGKLKNPLLFQENQNGNQNKTKEVKENYQKYAKGLIAHVAEGVNLAKEAHLPDEVINLIKQHHGTSIAKYYFEKAKEKNPIQVNRKYFRYKGPKPQTKETAIVNLADSLEAISRSEPEKFQKPLDFEIFVDEVIKAKEQEGQFLDIKFSTTELVKLRKSFASTLQSIYHSRIKYPNQGGVDF